MDDGDDVQRFRVAQIEHRVRVGAVEVDRSRQQVVAEVADAGILRKAVEAAYRLSSTSMLRDQPECSAIP